MSKNANASFKIPNANTLALLMGAGVVRGNDRFCGRFFANTNAATASLTLCSKCYLLIKNIINS